MKLSRKKQNSPAATVVLLDDKGGEVMSVDLVPALEISTPWPDSCGVGKDVEKWLGKKTKQRNKSFYFVAKQPRGHDDKGNLIPFLTNSIHLSRLLCYGADIKIEFATFLLMGGIQ